MATTRLCSTTRADPEVTRAWNVVQVPITYLLIPGEKITARICTDLDGKVSAPGSLVLARVSRAS